MTTQAAAAAAWWASRLGNATHDLGQRDPSARRGAAAANAFTALAGRAYTDGQVEAFRRELEAGIEAMIRKDEETGHWRAGDPLWGSALRAVAVGYAPDGMLCDAGERAGIQVGILDLPMQTVMWVDPGRVTVSEGYGAPCVAIWPEAG